MIPFDKALFKAPNFSVFDMSHDNKLDMGLGRVVPVFWKWMHPNERIQCEVGNLVRMQPLNGAILQHYDITFDSFFIPARLIFGREKSERFFNLYQSNGTDAWYSGGQIPLLPWDFLVKNSKSGTLLDYLGYPTFPNLRQAVLEFANGVYFNSLTEGLSGTGLLSTDVAISIGQDDSYFFPDSYSYHVSFLRPGSYVGAQSVDVIFPKSYFGIRTVGEVSDAAHDILISDDDLPYGYLNWLYTKAGFAPEFGSISYSSFVFDADFYASHSYEEALKKLSVSPEKALEMYLDYLLDWLIDIGEGSLQMTAPSNPIYSFVQSLADDTDQAPSVAPLFAYWRCISDWYFNYNLSDMPEYELYDYIKSLAMPDSPYDYDMLMEGGQSGTVYDFFYSWKNPFSPRTSGPSGGMLDCFRRNWANDYFTSAFRSPQSGNAVPLPTAENASIVDLRRANVLQEMYERVLYAGRKYRDQVRAFFNVVPANSRLDVTEVIAREVQPLQISEVTQTNQGDLDKMLETPIGAFAGQSQTVGSHKLSDYTSDEHGMFMVMASIRPRSAYFQGVRKELLKTDVYDFLWPQMENIGEQEVISAEIFADYDPDSVAGAFTTTFGWQRRYAEFMYHPSEVHGDLQNSLDYLHSARKFDHKPNLNVQFGEIRPEDDDLNRVFVYSADERPFIVELYFDCKMIRPLSRYLHYDL